MKSVTPIRDLTAAARASLSGNWGKSIGVMLVYIFLSIGISKVPHTFGLLQWIFAAPLIVGVTVYFLATVRRQDNRFSLMFDGFNRFGTAVFTYLLVSLIILAWTFPLWILMTWLFITCVDGQAIVAVWIDVFENGAQPDMSCFNGLGLVAIVFLVICALMIPIQMRYGLALYVVADDPSVRGRQAVRRGVELMKGNYWRLGLFWLRFIGWQILAVLTLGIGFIWLAPYYMASMTAFYDDLAKKG
jgi:uncharacterized membrane protein